MSRKLFYLLLLTLASCTGGLKEKSKSDNDLAAVELRELNGEKIDLEQYKGKTIFINFWATWCKPCIQEMPTIANAQEKFKNEEVIFLFASNEEPDQIESFMKKHTYNFKYVRSENLEALNIQALPTTFIFSPAGKLKFSENGFRIWDAPENIDLITKITAEND